MDIVRRRLMSGSQVPYDQPAVSLELIQKWLAGEEL